MKFQIDVDKKMVKIVEGGNLGEMVKILKKLLGDDYKDYEVEADYYIYWDPYPTYTIRYDSGSPTYSDWNTTNVGVYNLCVVS